MIIKLIILSIQELKYYWTGSQNQLNNPFYLIGEMSKSLNVMNQHPSIVLLLTIDKAKKPIFMMDMVSLLNKICDLC